MNTLTRRSRWIAPITVAAFALTGCTGKSGEDVDGDGGVGQATASPAPQLQFRFNDLNGGSRFIFVYPGTSDSVEDKTDDGFYEDGTVVSIQCHETGRRVVSHPDQGEDQRSSYDWYRLVGEKVVQYATGTYGDVIPTGATVPECPAPLLPLPTTAAVLPGPPSR